MNQCWSGNWWLCYVWTLLIQIPFLRFCSPVWFWLCCHKRDEGQKRSSSHFATCRHFNWSAGLSVGVGSAGRSAGFPPSPGSSLAPQHYVKGPWLLFRIRDRFQSVLMGFSSFSWGSACPCLSSPLLSSCIPSYLPYRLENSHIRPGDDSLTKAAYSVFTIV